MDCINWWDNEVMPVFVQTPWNLKDGVSSVLKLKHCTINTCSSIHVTHESTELTELNEKVLCALHYLITLWIRQDVLFQCRVSSCLVMCRLLTIITLECCTSACRQKDSTFSEGTEVRLWAYGSPLPPKHHRPPCNMKESEHVSERI